MGLLGAIPLFVPSRHSEEPAGWRDPQVLCMEFFATILLVKVSVAGSMFRGTIFLHGSQLRAFHGQLAKEENSFLQTAQMMSIDHAWHALGVNSLFRPMRTGVLRGRSVRPGRLW